MKKTVRAKTPKTTKKPKTTPVRLVGIGASAGGLEAFRKLLSFLPADTGLSFVLIQHLDPTHPSAVAEILGRATRMPVTELKGSTSVKPNHIYVIPPASDVSLLKNNLKLQPRMLSLGLHLPINFFLESLANEKKNQSIAVILSGTATDGTLGLGAIKAQGGITLVQEPRSAKHDGMPQSAIRSGMVDFVLTPENIARELVKIAQPSYVRLPSKQGPEKIKEKSPAGKLASVSDSPLEIIVAVLRNATHLDFSLYKTGTLERRAKRRMLVHKISDLKAYARYLQTHPDEAELLAADFLIHVTEFFRDGKTFEALKKRVFPRLLKAHPKGATLRVWVPGCSTGEEAYSIAINLLEFFDAKRLHISLQIFGTDISETAIQTARRGLYPESISKAIPAARLRRYFDKIETGYQISKSIRDLCLFSRHDVTSDPPFARIDLISCHNLLIYFSAELQKRVIPIFHYALNPGGLLWLGRSESLTSFPDLFELMDKANKFYVRKESARRSSFRFPISAAVPLSLASPTRPRVFADSRLTVQKEADRLALEEYAPPGVLVDDHMDILQVRGDTSPYLGLAPGQASLSLLKMVSPELAVALRYAIQGAKKSGLPVEENGLEIGGRKFNLKVTPVKSAQNSQSSQSSKERFFSIVFEELTAGGKKFKAYTQPKLTPAQIRAHQSKAAREALSQQHQALIEDFEATREELVSSNEELQSSNEELQSTNEELETAKEELQSSNEELTTVNEELQTRNAEILYLNSDLTNLLTSVDLPIVMVGHDNRIRRFTPKAARMLSLIVSDVGRPIGDIKPKIKSVELDEIVSQVIESVVTKEIETQDVEGAWHKLVVRPYRTAENKTDGAVIALFDIDALKRSELELKVSRDDAQTVFDSSPVPLLVVEADLGVRSVNQAFFDTFKVNAIEVTGVQVADLGNGQWNIPALLDLLRGTLVRNELFRNYEVSHDFRSIGRRSMLVSARRVTLKGSGAQVALVAIEDITERRLAETGRRTATEKYRNLLSAAYDSIIAVNSRGTIEFVNERVSEVFGYASRELTGKPFELLFAERTLAHHEGFRSYSFDSPEPKLLGQDLKLFARRKDGHEFPVNIAFSPLETPEGNVVTAIVRDLSELQQSQIERQERLSKETTLRQQAESANRTKDLFLATLSHELRTPLTIILTWAQLLRRGPKELEKTQYGIQMIQDAGKSLAQLIDDLLEVTHMQSGKFPLERAFIDPVEVVQSALEAAKLLSDGKSLQFKTEFSAAAMAVYADPLRLKQIVFNLLTNAIKFSKNSPEIEVKVASSEVDHESHCRIQVTDHGKGIDPKFLPHIFQYFTQEDSSTTRGYGGLGLGLAIVRGLVELHGGRVLAESEGLGKGASFTVLLPMSRPSKALVTPERQTELEREKQKEKNDAGGPQEVYADLSGLRVVVVDDEAKACEVFSEMLTSMGARVSTALSAKEALTAISDFDPDILISDIAMPDEDGFSLIRKVRALAKETHREMPAIAITAHTGSEYQTRAISAGFDAHMTKPLEVKRLATLVLKLCASRRAGKKT